MLATLGGINLADHVSSHVESWYNMTVVFYEHCTIPTAQTHKPIRQSQCHCRQSFFVISIPFRRTSDGVTSHTTISQLPPCRSSAGVTTYTTTSGCIVTIFHKDKLPRRITPEMRSALPTPSNCRCRVYPSVPACRGRPAITDKLCRSH